MPKSNNPPIWAINSSAPGWVKKAYYRNIYFLELITQVGLNLVTFPAKFGRNQQNTVYSEGRSEEVEVCTEGERFHHIRTKESRSVYSCLNFLWFHFLLDCVWYIGNVCRSRCAHCSNCRYNLWFSCRHVNLALIRGYPARPLKSLEMECFVFLKKLEGRLGQIFIGSSICGSGTALKCLYPIFLLVQIFI